MKIYLDEYGGHGDGDDVIVVDLDDGTHVSAWCVVDDAEKEMKLFTKHLTMIRDEAVAEKDEEIAQLKESIVKQAEQWLNMRARAEAWREAAEAVEAFSMPELCKRGCLGEKVRDCCSCGYWTAEIALEAARAIDEEPTT